jgi:subtilisin family serine protease
MSVPPFFRNLTRAVAARRLTIILSLVFAAAVTAPFVTEGAREQRSEESAPFRLRRAGAKPVAADAAEFVPGSVLVRFRTETAARKAEGTPATGRGVVLDDGANGQIGATVTRFEGSDLVRGLRLVQVDPDQTLAAVEAFKSRPDVLYAEPDYVRRATTNTPNDPLFNQMYGLLKISAPGAWDTTQGGGSSVVVGVVDEGVDINHPDLQANIWTNPGETPGNGVDDDGDGKIDDVHGWDFSTCTGSTFTITTPPDNCGNNTVYDGPGIEDSATKFPTDGHGTHVAGTIGAVGNNSTGVVGVNWNVKILPLKFLGTSGGSSSNAIRAEAYAKALRDKYVATGGMQGANVRVLNNSYGGGGSSQAELDSIKAVGDSGILFVVAAGNETSNNDLVATFPSNYDAPNLIAVAATDSNDQISSFSNFGAHLVSVAAPGSSILSTFARTSASQTYASNGYAFLSGTSMATPHVAGLAALICALNPQIDVLKLRNIIAYNGDPISAATGKVYTQRRINAAASVQAALENDATPPAALGNLQVAQSGRSVTLSFAAPGDDLNSGTASLYDISFISASTGTTYFLKTQLPKAGGSADSITVNVPLRQTSGTLRVKTFDNVGNVSVSDTNVTVDPSLADPYTTSETGNTGLASLGSALTFHLDDGYKDVPLPSGFSFPFFGQQNTSVVISSNGALYLQPLSTLAPADPNNDLFGDSVSSTQGLEGYRMVAGLWDDLRTDCATGGSGVPCDVYENTSDPNKVIFRWEGVPCNFNGTACTGTTPVEFEIELDRDGTIVTRYGAGNTNVQPVVGIGAGEPGGSYVISSHSYPPVTSLTNAATVTFTPRPAVVPATLQFSSASYTFSEANITPQGTNAAQIVVTRAGDTSAPASVDVRTVDNPAAVACSDTTSLPGVAFARCDYETVVTTVSFAAGDSSPKTVTIPLVNDSFVEPNETFNVVLVNPQGATLAAPSTTTVTLTSDDAAGQPDPIFGTDFFIRQQYLDFLSREPDAAGFNNWQALLNGCPNPFNIDPNNPSHTCDRVTVSANFFLSAEFQLKGAYVFRFYKLALNRLPLYTEFSPDTASVTGATAAEVFQKKAAFANSFTQRQEFAGLYGGLDNTAFVNALMDRYALSSVTTPDPLNPDGSTKITMTRADMINRLNGVGSALTRAQVLRAIADSDEVGSREFNSAFVAMQYFGYLRRDPDTGGYNNWLTYLNTHPGDSRTMVVGFVTSGEYYQRFGQP